MTNLVAFDVIWHSRRCNHEKYNKSASGILQHITRYAFFKGNFTQYWQSAARLAIAATSRQLATNIVQCDARHSIVTDRRSFRVPQNIEYSIPVPPHVLKNTVILYFGNLLYGTRTSDFGNHFISFRSSEIEFWTESRIRMIINYTFYLFLKFSITYDSTRFRRHVIVTCYRESFTIFSGGSLSCRSVTGLIQRHDGIEQCIIYISGGFNVTSVQFCFQ